MDEPRHASDTAQFVSKELRAGFQVDRMPVEDVRALPWGWPCEHMKAATAEQLDLLASTTSGFAATEKQAG